MTTTTNLGLTQLEVGQKEKEVTINTNNATLDTKVPIVLADAAVDPSAVGRAPGTMFYDTAKKVLKVLRNGGTWNVMSGYIGEFAADPATTNLQAGSTYFNTTSSKLKVLKTDLTWVNAA